MNTTTWLFAALAGAGVLLAWIGATTRAYVRLVPVDQRGMLARLNARLQAADIPLSAREFLLTGLGIGAALAGGVLVILGPTILAGVVICIGPVIYWQVWAAKQERFKRDYVNALSQAIETLLRSYSANPNLNAALQEATPYMREPVRNDFVQVVTALQTRATLSDAIYQVAERRHNPYFDMLAEALAVREQQGGKLKTVLEGLQSLLRGVIQIQNEIRARQTQPKLEGTIVAIAPFVFLVLLKLALRDYEGGFYATLEGQIVLAVAIVFSGVAYLLAQKIAKAGLDLEAQGATR
ncbi:MAG TPA: type II secretion system F family protein [Anaerolineae bacterium]|nr:type II secretion system F family protein [Anaerolineae bacterium]HQI83384.1 type II secretion system F family protein [Anaerolineae bacterium]